MFQPNWFHRIKTSFFQLPLHRYSRMKTLRERYSAGFFETLESRLTFSGFGTTDGSYILESWSGEYRDVQIQPIDQKIVVAGTKQTDQSNALASNLSIARYDATGNADLLYGSGGASFPVLGAGNETGASLILQPDGKAVVAGANSINTSLAVARFNNNGSLDTTFGSSGWNSLDVRSNDYETAYGVARQSSGAIVVAGYSVTEYPVPSIQIDGAAGVARFKASGAIDSGKNGFGQIVNGKATGSNFATFGAKWNSFNSVVTQADDKVVTVGNQWDIYGNRRLVVARFTANGLLDATFNGTGFSVFQTSGIDKTWGNAVALQPYGKVLIAGAALGSDGAQHILVARYNANGTLDTSFGGIGYVLVDSNSSASATIEVANDIAVQSDGAIFVAGTERSNITGSAKNVLVARLTSAGILDSTFGSSGIKIGTPLSSTGYHNFNVYGLGLQADGSIIVAGSDLQDAAPPNSSTMMLATHPLLMRFDSATSGGASTSNSKAAVANDTALSLMSFDDIETINRRKNAPQSASKL